MLSVPVIAIVLFLLLDAGIVMTAIALRPRRVGDTPRCPECEYNLTGLITEDKRARCPECGITSSTVSLNYGERRVPRRLLLAGLLLTALSGTPLISGLAVLLRGVDLYPYMPARALVTGLRWGDDKIAKRSVDELRGRLTADTLSAEELDALVEACLDEQARSKLREDISHDIINLLSLPPVAGAMTDEQKQRMYANMVRDVRVYSRRIVISGDDIPLAGESVIRAPDGFRVRCRTRWYREGEEAPQKLKPWMPSAGVTWYEKCTVDPGMYELRTEIVVQSSDRNDAPIVYSRALQQTLSMEVLAPDAPSPVKTVRSAELDAEIPRHVVSSAVSIQGRNTYSQTDTLGVEICRKGAVQSNLAFDVYVVWDDNCDQLGRVFCYSSSGGSYGCIIDKTIARPVPEHVDLVLRSSTKAAERSLEIDKIWGGDLLIENVPVNPSSGGYTFSLDAKTYQSRLIDRATADELTKNATE